MNGFGRGGAVFHKCSACNNVEFRGWYYYEYYWIDGVLKFSRLDIRVEYDLTPGLGEKWETFKGYSQDQEVLD